MGATKKYEDPRAHALRERYHELFEAPELPVPVESIAEDLLGLAVEEDDDLRVSGMLLPSERRIILNGRESRESPGRRRFTLAHELGHWICQCQDGNAKPLYCRAEEIGVDPEARAGEREANVFAAELLMPEEWVRGHARDREVASAFGVSSAAMGWRLYSFGLAERPREATT